MKYYLLIILNLFFVKLFSQSSNIVSKENIFYNNYDKKYIYKGELFTGIMKSGRNEITFERGIPNGLIRNYDENGRIYRELNCSNGVFDGRFFIRLSDGRYYRGIFLNDLVGDKFRVYDKDGKISKELNFSPFEKVPSKISFEDDGINRYEGILVKDRELRSIDLQLDIQDFIDGADFTNIGGLSTGPEISKENSIQYSWLKNGNFQFRQIFKDSLYLGFVKYENYYKQVDSTVFINPITINQLIESMLPSANRGDLISITESNINFFVKKKGKLITEYTKIYKINPESRYYEENYINRSMGSDWNDNKYYEINYNEKGELDGDYTRLYTNGNIEVKASFSKNKLNLPFVYNRSNGTKRLSFYKKDNIFIFEEYFLDGSTKLKINISEINSEKFSNNLIHHLSLKLIPDSRDRITINEDDDLLHWLNIGLGNM